MLKYSPVSGWWRQDWISPTFSTSNIWFSASVGFHDKVGIVITQVWFYKTIQSDRILFMERSSRPVDYPKYTSPGRGEQTGTLFWRENVPINELIISNDFQNDDMKMKINLTIFDLTPLRNVVFVQICI